MLWINDYLLHVHKKGRKFNMEVLGDVITCTWNMLVLCTVWEKK